MYENIRVALKDGRFIVQLFIIKLSSCQRSRDPYFCRKRIYCSMLYQGLPYLSGSMECCSGAKLNTAPDTRPAALIEDKYAIAVKHEEQMVGHVPKFLSKLTFFFLKMVVKLSSK